MTRTPKEAIYDELISPLMAQIIALCKEHRINMIADFALGYDPDQEQDLFCTTCMHNVDPDDKTGTERMLRARRELMRRPDFMAFTVIGGKS